MLFDDGNFSHAPLDRGLVEFADSGAPFVRVPIACKSNDFGLEPRETALDSSAKRVAVGKFLEHVKRRNSTKADVIEDQNVGEFASIEPFSAVVRGLRSIIHRATCSFTCAGGADSYIHKWYFTVSSNPLKSRVLV